MQDRISPHCLLLTLALLPFATTASADDTTGTLTVDVSNIQSDAGQIGCSLYSKKDGFPSDPDKAAKSMFVKSKAGKATCVFKGIEPGKYAVSVMHDEDKDGALKTSMVGRPKEWWGVSNNVPPERFGPPKYEAATFSHGGEPTTIQVKLRL
jgi:uncharacterized protein (DUF2141 family)